MMIARFTPSSKVCRDLFSGGHARSLPHFERCDITAHQPTGLPSSNNHSTHLLVDGEEAPRSGTMGRSRGTDAAGRWMERTCSSSGCRQARCDWRFWRKCQPMLFLFQKSDKRLFPDYEMFRLFICHQSPSLCSRKQEHLCKRL